MTEQSPSRGLARFVCWLRGHEGQKEGGTIMFTCPRCRRSFFQRHDFSAVERQADALIAQGRDEEALRIVRAEIQRHA